MPVLVAVITDRTIIAEALTALLRVDPRVAVVAAAAFSATETLPPAVDVVIADLDAFSARALLGRLRHDCGFVHLTRHSPPIPLQRTTGLSVTLPRDASAQSLIAVASALAARDSGAVHATVGHVDIAHGDRALSAREIEIVRLIAAGHTQSSIATALGIGKKTVQTYRARAADKLMLRTRVDFVRYAKEQGWLD